MLTATLYCCFWKNQLFKVLLCASEFTGMLKGKQMISTESKNYFFVQFSGRLLYPIMRVLSLDVLFFHSPQAIDCWYAFQI